MQLLQTALAIVFVVALALLLVLSNLRSIVMSPATYEDGYVRYGAASATGMSEEELRESARQLIAYFADGSPITLQVRKEWGIELLFNQRELDHLADVRDLIQLALRAQMVAGLYVALFIALTYLWYRPQWLEALARYVLAAGGFIMLVFAALAVAFAVSFDELFLRFHLISFSNDLWQLDPRTDYMIRMFPQGFWFEQALRLGVWTLAEGAALTGLAWGFLRWRATTRGQG